MVDIFEDKMEDEGLEEDTQKDRYMAFGIGKELFAIPITHVNEIVGMQKITIIPEVESYIKGLVNLRGKIIPVIDMSLRFGLPEKEYTDRTCIVVVDINRIVVGLIIESIAEVVRIEEDQILPPPSVNRQADSTKYVYGIGKTAGNVYLLLDPGKLLRDEEAVALVGVVPSGTKFQEAE